MKDQRSRIQEEDVGKGKIDISYYTKLYTNDVDGNEESSPLEEGAQGYNELVLDICSPLSTKWQLEGHFEGIQTSDETENEKEHACRSYYLRLSKGSFDITAGDFFENFSQYTLGTDLLGF